MADFVYESEAGETVTRTFRRKAGPPKSITVDGVVYRRSWAPETVAAVGGVRSAGARGNRLHFKAWSQRPVPAGEDPRKYGFERVDTDGIGLVDGEREMRRYIHTQNELANKGQADHKGIEWLGDKS